MKPWLAIHNLNGKESRWWRDLKHTKRDEVKDIKGSSFNKIFQENYIYKIFFDRKVK